MISMFLDSRSSPSYGCCLELFGNYDCKRLVNVKFSSYKGMA